MKTKVKGLVNKLALATVKGNKETLSIEVDAIKIELIKEATINIGSKVLDNIAKTTKPSAIVTMIEEYNRAVAINEIVEEEIKDQLGSLDLDKKDWQSIRYELSVLAAKAYEEVKMATPEELPSICTKISILPLLIADITNGTKEEE